MAHNYKDLKIWQRSIDLVDLCYDYVGDLPQDERFNLKSQIIRCACSVPANIAEGAAKNSQKDFARFPQISLGSCFELESHLILCMDLEIINNLETIGNLKNIQQLQKKIYSLIKYVSTKT